MNITIETEITELMTCAACWEDRDASEGVACECIERDVRLEVTAEVSLVEDSEGARSSIDIFRIRDLDRKNTWSRGEVAGLDKKDRAAIEEELWLKYLETEPRMVLRKDISDLCDSLKTHCALALETGTDIERIKGMLVRVKRAILDVRQGGEARS